MLEGDTHDLFFVMKKKAMTLFIASPVDWNNQLAWST